MALPNRLDEFIAGMDYYEQNNHNKKFSNEQNNKQQSDIEIPKFIEIIIIILSIIIISLPTLLVCLLWISMVYHGIT
jgi:hypothetical protein